MTAVRRLVTFVDVDDPRAGTVSVSARHEAELADGRRVLLLDDRGWSSTQPWTAASVTEIEETTRTAVGPDEPFGDRSQHDMAADHWASLQQIARRQGVAVDAAELREVPHDVELSQRVLARIRGGPDAGRR